MRRTSGGSVAHGYRRDPTDVVILMSAGSPRDGASGERSTLTVEGSRPATHLAYDGERVIVTGGAGFIGHHLVAALMTRGAHVLVIDDLSAGKAERLPPTVAFERLDIAKDDLSHAFHRWQPARIFHLAAQVSVPRSESEPEEDLRVNVLGTLRLVEAARSIGSGRIVYTSSGGAVYGETATPATERSPTRPGSRYGLHKLFAEQYIAESGLSHAIVRPSNVYGPGQDAIGEGGVVAVFTAAAREGRAVVIHGDGAQERDFLYVEDLVEGLLVLGSADQSGTWNASVGLSTSIIELAAHIERITGQPLERNRGSLRPGDVRLSRIASTRLARMGWAPYVPLEDGLRRLILPGV